MKPKNIKPANKERVPFTAQQFAQLTLGTPVVLTRDTERLCVWGIPSTFAGTQTKVHSLDLGNNRVVVGPLSNGSTYYASAQDLYPMPGRTMRFGKVDVEAIRKQAGNDGIQKAITQRVNDARNGLAVAVAPEKFNEGMKTADEQIRQAKLLHSSLAK